MKLQECFCCFMRAFRELWLTRLGDHFQQEVESQIARKERNKLLRELCRAVFE